MLMENKRVQTTCAWAMKHELERKYHDQEWGVAVYDDSTLFEFITLEGAQAGLSWITILKKREGYRQAFQNYDIEKLACLDASNVDYVLENYDIVKHKGKIASVYNNARAARKLQHEYGSLSNALWQFVEGKPVINHWQSMDQVPVSTEVSKQMSSFLKKHGFKFVGEVTCYAFMQAVGMVDDHLVNCPMKITQ